MTPRAALQSLASSCGLSGRVQYVSSYALAMIPGWYIVTEFSRRRCIVFEGMYLGASYEQAKRMLQEKVK